jgi:hypothetical protein
VTLSEMNLRDDVAAALTAEDASHWVLVHPNPMEVWATFSPTQSPGETFQARLAWDRYPADPPSLKFRDPATGRLDLPRAWPQLPGFRPGSLDTCVSWTGEGARLHPEWAGDPRFRWDPSGNVLLKVLRILVSNFDTSFQGRHP